MTTVQKYTSTKTEYADVASGAVSWQSPSNIALVKYWGKHGIQLPKNPSISFTLKNCMTQTTVSYVRKITSEFELQVFHDGERALSFEPKIYTFFERSEPYLPFLRDFSFRIETTNSFPHSSGIASSASGMSALALCLMSIEKKMCDSISSDYFTEKASFLSRLGSGSACRSIEGPLVVWGAHKEIEGSSDLVGVRYPYEVHEVFHDYCDTILLVDKGEKQVSSTVGHNLMHGHPFADQRFLQANTNLTRMIPVLKEGNLADFIEIVESEALSLHAMMMTSSPYFILMKPNTLEILHRIWAYRKETGSSLCFTLDAGANVHLLYPRKEQIAVREFIETDLAQFCKAGSFIEDEVGLGAFSLDNQ